MSDLISRSALIERIIRHKEFGRSGNKEIDFCYGLAHKHIIELVEEAPKAYDVDAVVQEIENSTVCGMFGAMFGKSDAEIIDIIKAGGMK